MIHDESPANYRRLVEGAWLTRREGWYYLFYSGDNCCGPKAHYALMVARSRSATGPFETRAVHNGVILEQARHWLAPGHNSVTQDAAGEHWLLYHAVDTRRPRAKAGDEINSRRVMLLDKLIWRDGWPTLDNRGPSASRRPAPAVE